MVAGGVDRDDIRETTTRGERYTASCVEHKKMLAGRCSLNGWRSHTHSKVGVVCNIQMQLTAGAGRSLLFPFNSSHCIMKIDGVLYSQF